MVLPGWNVTEPISAAVKFCQLVQKYRDAPEEIQDFASHVNDFRQVLEAFDCCRTHPEFVDGAVRERLRSVSESCRQCAENCKGFVDKFLFHYENAPDEIRAANRLLWVWNQDKAINLGKRIQEHVSFINVHVNLAGWRNRQQQHEQPQQQPQQLQPLTQQEASQTAGSLIPITPAALLGGQTVATSPSFTATAGTFSSHDPSPETYQSPPSTHGWLEDLRRLNISPGDPFIEAQLNTRRWSLPDYVPQELGQRRNSNRNVYRLCPEMTMANLDGTVLHRKTGPYPPLEVSRIEFLKDFDDNLCYIVTFHANVKFFQKVSRSPPSIPHTEHPIAYKGQKLLRVRFLEPQDFKSHRGPSSVSAAIRRDQPAPSPIALGSPAMQGIPSTLASPSIVRGSVTIGSPSLPIGGSRIVKETPYPMYEFKLQQDYKQFQEHVMDRKLLVNAPIEKIESKPISSSRLRLESEKQYLRLWEHNGLQTIMYNANSQVPSVYVEHDVESFRPNVSQSTPARLVLDIKRTGPRKISEVLEILENLVIVFSDTQDRTTFLTKARFYGIPNPAMIPPLGL